METEDDARDANDWVVVAGQTGYSWTKYFVQTL